MDENDASKTGWNCVMGFKLSRAVVSWLGRKTAQTAQPEQDTHPARRAQGLSVKTRMPHPPQQNVGELRAASTALYRAMRGGIWGLGRDENTLFSVLHRVEPQQLPALLADYQAHYGQDLVEDLRAELSGWKRTYAETLVRGQVDEAEALLLRKSLRWFGVDESKVFAVLERSAARPEGFQKISAAYQKLFGKSLEKKLLRALSADSRPRAEALMKHDKAQADLHWLKKTLSQKTTPERDALVFSLLSKGVEQAAQRFLAACGVSLFEWIATHMEGPNRDAALAKISDKPWRYAAARMASVTQGHIPNHQAAEVVLEALWGTTSSQRSQIASIYEKLYGHNLVSDMAKLDNPQARDVALLLWQRGTFDELAWLHVFRHSPEELMALASRHSAAEMKKLQARYEERYHRALVDDATSQVEHRAQRVAVEQALSGRPQTFEEAVLRLRKRHAVMRSGGWNSLSRWMMDRVFRSRQGPMLDETLENLEKNLAEGVTQEKDIERLNSIINHSVDDLDTYRLAQMRATRISGSVGLVASLSGFLALGAGAGLPLLAFGAGAFVAGEAGKAGGEALWLGKSYTPARMLHTFLERGKEAQPHLSFQAFERLQGKKMEKPPVGLSDSELDAYWGDAISYADFPELTGRTRRTKRASTDDTKVEGSDDPKVVAQRYERPAGFRIGIRDAVWNAAKGADGKVRDPLTGRVIRKDEPWQMGHKPGYEFRKHQRSAARRGISRDQFIDEHNNPKHYRPELPRSNESHRGENKTDAYFGA